MKVLSVGGGSGGHVTPVLAVINELAELDSQLEVMLVCDKAFETQSRGLMQHAKVPVEVVTIPSGKFRRYHGVPLYKQLLDLETVGKNIFDVFKTTEGYRRSLKLLKTFKPDVVFAKGGFVCLPVGYAAKRLGIPLVIHDSDTRPGLTNRLLAKFANGIATGSPLENYPYNPSITRYVGVPVAAEFTTYTSHEQQLFKTELGFEPDQPLLVVVGGGLGAKSINTAIVSAHKSLLKEGIGIFHVCGKNNYIELDSQIDHSDNYQIVPFVFKDMYKVLAAADVVVSRGSATFLQELAALKKPVIVIPSKVLGDQVKNAAVYKAAGAARVLSDNDIANPEVLVRAILKILENPEEAEAMAAKLHEFARPSAARDTAHLVFEVGKGHAV